MARSSAGLAPETNLKEAKTRKTRPRLIRRTSMLWDSRRPVARSSRFATRVRDLVEAAVRASGGRAAMVDMGAVPLGLCGVLVDEHHARFEIPLRTSAARTNLPTPSGRNGLR